MKVYFISGLAADRRVFKYIRLPSSYEAIYLDWIEPLRNEALPAYALRLGSVIDTKEPFILAGLSLGGMLAAEIAKHHRPEKLILISSVPSPNQLPFYFRAIGKIGIHKLVPISFLKSASIIKRFFSTEASADKIYLRQTIKESDPAFVRWAINAILKWKGTQQIECIHIHGSRDLLLPCRYITPTHLLKGAGHMLILTHGKQVNQIIGEVLTRHQSAE